MQWDASADSLESVSQMRDTIGCVEYSYYQAQHYTPLGTPNKLLAITKLSLFREV